MTPPDDVPQTPKQARDYGWTWLTVACMSCKHRRQLKFTDLIAEQRGAIKLGAIADRSV